MSIVRAVRTLTESVQGLPEAARREITAILDELEGRTPPVVEAPRTEGEDNPPQSPAEVPSAPDADEATTAQEGQPAEAPTSEPGSADAPVNPQVVE